VDGMLKVLEAKDVSGQLFLSHTHQKVMQALQLADYLSPKYHVVIANPPYLGSKGMNGRLGAWAKDNYPNSKADLFAMFIERGFDMIKQNGFNAMVTMQSWMFLSSYEKLRNSLLSEVVIECLTHMGNMVMRIAFGTAATVWRKMYVPNYKGAFCFVENEDIGLENKPICFPPLNERNKAARKIGK
jgi:type I restriction-modification system DNA methylase subunit